MTEQARNRDVREIVGFPREPISKPKRADRMLLRKALETEAVDPAVGIRVSIALGLQVKPQWLTPELLDLALNAADAAKYFDKLVPAKRLLDATTALEFLQRKLDRKTANTVLAALRKCLVPRRGRKKQQLACVLNERSAVSVIRVITSIASILLADAAEGARKRIPEDLAELVASVVQGCKTPKVVAAGMGFLRVLERHAGWAVLERDGVGDVLQPLIHAPAELSSGLLEDGATSQLDELASRVSTFELADVQLKSSIAATLQTADQSLPIESRNWARRYLLLDDRSESTKEENAVVGDAPRERLAVILISSWEARTEGPQAAHAFSLTEEICKNGFAVYLAGDVGSNVEFDPDIHESRLPLQRGEACRLTRPWVEWHSPDSIRILIRARVTTIES